MLGKRFGRLVVTAKAASKGDKAAWLCKCDCGNTSVVRSDRLRLGDTRSCGCLAREESATRNASKREDLTGRRFGHYTVLGFIESRRSPNGARPRGGNAVWLCRCDCGRERSVQASSLKYTPNPKCKACADDAMVDPDWAAKALLKRYRFNATARGLQFDLTREEFLALVHLPCHYCGGVDQDAIAHGQRPDLIYRHNGVDRLNGGGYTLGNCAPCCWRCNRAKGGMTASEFLSLCRHIAGRHPVTD